VRGSATYRRDAAATVLARLVEGATR
jgi:hypothetical protein